MIVVTDRIYYAISFNKQNNIPIAIYITYRLWSNNIHILYQVPRSRNTVMINLWPPCHISVLKIPKIVMFAVSSCASNNIHSVSNPRVRLRSGCDYCPTATVLLLQIHCISSLSIRLLTGSDQPGICHNTNVDVCPCVCLQLSAIIQVCSPMAIGTYLLVSW